MADPATLRLRGDRGGVLHRHLAVLIDEPARAPFGNHMEIKALTLGNLYYRETLPMGNSYFGELLLHKNLAKARGDGSQGVADPATLRRRGDRGDVLHRHLAISIDEPARAPRGNYL